MRCLCEAGGGGRAASKEQRGMLAIVDAIGSVRVSHVTPAAARPGACSPFATYPLSTLIRARGGDGRRRESKLVITGIRIPGSGSVPGPGGARRGLPRGVRHKVVLLLGGP